MTLTQDQIDSFNGYQAWGGMHPFTCGNDSNHELLVAREDGLHCLNCDYPQDWAHEWMLNGEWRKMKVIG